MIKNKIIKFIESRFKYWGVEFQTNLPPEFIITDHAEMRITQRIGCKKEKMKRLAIKAWNAPKPANNIKINQKEYNNSFTNRQYFIHYRWLMGYIFVFAVVRNAKIPDLYKQKILVTVLN